MQDTLSFSIYIQPNWDNEHLWIALKYFWTTTTRPQRPLFQRFWGWSKYTCLTVLQIISAVFDMLAIIGGNSFSLDWNLLMPDGSECTNHDMPNLPATIRNFGAAQAYDRFIVLCGGQDASNTDCKCFSFFWQLQQCRVLGALKKL